MWREELIVPHARLVVLFWKRGIYRLPPAVPLPQLAPVQVQQTLDGLQGCFHAASGRRFAEGHLLEEGMEAVRPLEDGPLLVKVPR
jgi:hypothetical protein